MGRKHGRARTSIASCHFLFFYFIFIFSTDLAGCCRSVLAKKSALSCTADTPVTQRALSIFSPRALSCLVVGDEELTAGRDVHRDAGGAEDEERKARELSKFSSQLLTWTRRTWNTSQSCLSISTTLAGGFAWCNNTRQTLSAWLPLHLHKTHPVTRLCCASSIGWWGELNWSPEVGIGSARTNRKK